MAHAALPPPRNASARTTPMFNPKKLDLSLEPINVQSYAAPNAPAKPFAAYSNAESNYSIINEWLIMRGDLESSGDILVKGKVHGNIRCRMLIIDTDAQVEGRIDCEEIVVRARRPASSALPVCASRPPAASTAKSIATALRPRRAPASAAHCTILMTPPTRSPPSNRTAKRNGPAANSAQRVRCVSRRRSSERGAAFGGC